MDYSLYEIMDMPNPNFPIKMGKSGPVPKNDGFLAHWHEHVEMLYFVSGSASVGCGSKNYEVETGDLIIVNSSELHKLESKDNNLVYYCIIYDLPLLLGSESDTCNTKYLSQISQNRILFKNQIRQDRECNDCIEKMLSEYEHAVFGYELEIKSLMLHLITILLRNHVDRTLTPEEHDRKMQMLFRFEKLFQYIEVHYASPITTQSCASHLNLSLSHFCHIFKEVTGQGLTDYVNRIRISKAQTLLQGTDMSITEIALAVGFNDLGYFTRFFKKVTKTTPSGFRKTVY